MVDLSEMREALSEAEAQIYRTERMTADMAYLLKGRLRGVTNGYHHKFNQYQRAKMLAALKRELADFNASTLTWKD